MMPCFTRKSPAKSDILKRLDCEHGDYILATYTELAYGDLSRLHTILLRWNA